MNNAKDLKLQLKWEVNENPSHYQNKYGMWTENDTKTLTRSDNDRKLVVVNNTFGVMKNQQLVEGVERLRAVSGFNVKGYDDSFHGGRKVLAYLENPNNNLVINGSPIKSYLVLGSANDGSKSTFIGTTDIVLSCMNQFSQITQLNVIKHTLKHDAKFNTMIKEFQNYLINRKHMVEKLERFADLDINRDAQIKLIENLLKFEGLELKEVSTKKRNIFERVLENVELETDIHGRNGWGVFNGITRYTTHELEPKNEVFGNYFGTQNTLNQKIFTSLDKMLVTN